MVELKRAGHVAVLGAGMVGVSCALALQARGVAVTLVDRRLPGQETSFGNAGVIARSSLIPFNHHGLWRALPGLLAGRSAGFRYRAWHLLRQARWGIGFLRHARPEPFGQTVAALDALIRLSTAQHRRWAVEAGVAQRFRDDGWLFLYRSEAAYATAAWAREIYADHGVATEALDAAGLHDLEPHLKPTFPRALWVRDALSVDNPRRVVEAYARLFVERGGRIERRAVSGLRRTAHNGWQVLSSADAIPPRTGRLLSDPQRDDPLSAKHLSAKPLSADPLTSDPLRADLPSTDTLSVDQVVIALGPWTPDLLTTLGLTVPMACERGYHRHYAAQGAATLNRPVHDSAGGYVLSPMDGGLRLSTGVELAPRDAPQDLTQIDQAEHAARSAFPLGDSLHATPWLGSRPTLPDSRPAIGPVPGRPGLWVAFGHQHIGFSTGPGTGELLADLMLGRAAPIDARPFDPARFVR